MKVFGKNISVKKRSTPLNEKEQFCDILEVMEDNMLRLNELFKLGLDFINYEDSFYLVTETLLRLHYGDWQTDLITWYLYDRKDYNTGEIALMEWTNEDTDETKEVEINTPSDLWDAIQEISRATED